jgi:DNA-binding MarR family transcriptional regulator
MIDNESITMNVDGGEILINLLDDKDATIEMLREQIRALNYELIRVKQKLKNLEEKND